MAQAFQTIASGGNRAPLSALRSVIAEDGSVLYQSFPQAERAVPAQAAYMTLWTMQQVVQRGTGRQLGRSIPVCIWRVKPGPPTTMSIPVRRY